jgi:branched-subunit amino acid permease
MTQMQVLWLLQSRRGFMIPRLSDVCFETALADSHALASALQVVWFTWAFSSITMMFLAILRMQSFRL